MGKQTVDRLQVKGKKKDSFSGSGYWSRNLEAFETKDKLVSWPQAEKTHERLCQVDTHQI